MGTVRDEIKGALRLIGAIATGETPTADEQADALGTLINMLASWSTENLSIHARTRDSLSWSAGEASRTWGTAGNFTSTRPVELEYAAISSGGVEYALRVLSPQEWQAITQKAMTGAPTSVYFEGTYPTATVYLWPVPSATVTFVPYTLKPLTEFTSANDDVEFPPGYSRAIRYNLAIELAPEYGKAVSGEVQKIAQEAKESIKRKNIKPLYMVSDVSGVVGSACGFDFNSGE